MVVFPDSIHKISTVEALVSVPSSLIAFTEEVRHKRVYISTFLDKKFVKGRVYDEFTVNNNDVILSILSKNTATLSDPTLLGSMITKVIDELMSYSTYDTIVTSLLFSGTVTRIRLKVPCVLDTAIDGALASFHELTKFLLKPYIRRTLEDLKLLINTPKVSYISRPVDMSSENWVTLLIFEQLKVILDSMTPTSSPSIGSSQTYLHKDELVSALASHFIKEAPSLRKVQLLNDQIHCLLKRIRIEISDDQTSLTKEMRDIYASQSEFMALKSNCDVITYALSRSPSALLNHMSHTQWNSNDSNILTLLKSSSFLKFQTVDEYLSNFDLKIYRSSELSHNYRKIVSISRVVGFQKEDVHPFNRFDITNGVSKFTTLKSDLSITPTIPLMESMISAFEKVYSREKLHEVKESLVFKDTTPSISYRGIISTLDLAKLAIALTPEVYVKIPESIPEADQSKWNSYENMLYFFKIHPPYEELNEDDFRFTQFEGQIYTSNRLLAIFLAARERKGTSLSINDFKVEVNLSDIILPDSEFNKLGMKELDTSISKDLDVTFKTKNRVDKKLKISLSLNQLSRKYIPLPAYLKNGSSLGYRLFHALTIKNEIEKIASQLSDATGTVTYKDNYIKDELIHSLILCLIDIPNVRQLVTTIITLLFDAQSKDDRKELVASYVLTRTRKLRQEVLVFLISLMVATFKESTGMDIFKVESKTLDTIIDEVCDDILQISERMLVYV